MNTGIILSFLSGLKQHNHSEWFQEHKKDYQKARAEFENLITELIPALQQLDPSVGDIDVKSSIFRINRDVRFSKNKDPYKTNFGSFMARGGRKSIFGGYYVQIEPDASFVGGGVYCPQGPALKKLRTEIYYNPEEFRRIIEEGQFQKAFGGLAEMEKLKKGPVGFDKNFEHMDLLLHKNYVTMRALSRDELLSENLVRLILESFAAMVPLNSFLNRALGE